MPAPHITPLPTPPSRSQSPDTFSTDADAFLGALPEFQTDANTQADYLDGLADQVTLDAASANAAAAVATGAANYKGDYSAGITYQIGESVSYNGRRYVAKTVNTGIIPADGANWFLINDGDVLGPVSATNNALVLFDGTTGKLLKNGVGSGTLGSLLASGGSGNAPNFLGQGTSGQVLTSNGSGSAPYWATPQGVGSGGDVVTAPIALTSSSPAQQSVSNTDYGQAVTLPDATTLNEGVPVFGIFNSGKYPLLINDYAGTLLGFVEPRTNCICSLASGITAAGNWDLLGHRLFGIDACKNVTYPVNIGSFISATAIDANRTLLLTSSTSGGYGVIYDKSSRTIGSPVLIRTGNVRFVKALLIGENSVLVTSIISTAFQAVNLTISGNAITVNTAASATLPSGETGSDTKAEIVAVGSTYLFAHPFNTAGSPPQVIPMTVSGTTVTIGSAVNLQGQLSVFPVLFPLTSSTFVAFTQNTNGATFVTPYSVSGTTLTQGTSTSLSSTVNNFYVRQMGSRFAVVYYNASFCVVAVVSISGTVASATTANAFAASYTLRWFHVVNGNQLIIVGADTSAANCSINIVTDDAGTARAGTAITLNLLASFHLNFAYLGGTSSEMWIFVPNGASNAAGRFMSISSSGNLATNNPVISNVTFVAAQDNQIRVGKINQDVKYDEYSNALTNAKLNLYGASNSEIQTYVYNGSYVNIDQSLPLSLSVRENSSEGWTMQALDQNNSILQFRHVRLAP